MLQCPGQPDIRSRDHEPLVVRRELCRVPNDVGCDNVVGNTLRQSGRLYPRQRHKFSPAAGIRFARGRQSPLDIEAGVANEIRDGLCRGDLDPVIKVGYGRRSTGITLSTRRLVSLFSHGSKERFLTAAHEAREPRFLNRS